MRHGYYLPAFGTEHGDAALSKAAHFLWDHLHQRSGRDWITRPPARYDGVSLFTREDGFIRPRVVSQNVHNAEIVWVDGHPVSESEGEIVVGDQPFFFEKHPALVAAGLV